MSDEHVDDDTGDRHDRRYPSAPHAASHRSTPAGWLAGALTRPVSLVRMVPKRRRTRPEDP
ncbi:hypothetical protein, partial [Frankia sp. Cr1]|uniref:hypothetical protein n=1 Tax=Frankia sp. Cr1 TaxID=3073931 RepID=UPI002AD41E61